jgi:hypothetical protein
MKIVMKETMYGRRDNGSSTELFQEGVQYNVDGELLQAMIDNKWAEEVKESKKVRQGYEKKVVNHESEENKKEGGISND